jgi:hypothetical protein
MVMVECPLTHKAVPTGIVTDKTSFKLHKGECADFRCLACGQLHHLSLNEAWLAKFDLPAECIGAPSGTITLTGFGNGLLMLGI